MEGLSVLNSLNKYINEFIRQLKDWREYSSICFHLQLKGLFTCFNWPSISIITICSSFYWRLIKSIKFLHVFAAQINVSLLQRNFKVLYYSLHLTIKDLTIYNVYYDTRCINYDSVVHIHASQLTRMYDVVNKLM